jgi:hypothetical protein
LSSSTVRVTSPIRAASSASIRSPRKYISRAFAVPSSRVISHDPPKSPENPIPTNADPNRADRAAMRRSQLIAKPSPAPAAGPLIIPMMTFGTMRISSGNWCISRSCSTRCS